MPAIANRSFLVELPVNRQTGCVVSRLSFEFSRIDVTRPLLLLRYIHPNKAELWLHHKLVVCDPYLDGISSLRGLNPLCRKPFVFRHCYYTTGKNISTPYFKKFFTVLKYGLFMRYFKGFKYSRTSTNLDLSQFL